MPRIDRVIMFIGFVGDILVTPHDHHRNTLGSQRGKDTLCPVIGLSEGFLTRFGDAAGLQLFTGKLRQRLQVRSKGRRVEPVVAIHTDEVNPFVARPAERQTSPRIGIFRVHLG